MALLQKPHPALGGAALRLAAATILIAVGMDAVIGYFAGELDRTRVEQIAIGDLDRRTTGLLSALDRTRLDKEPVPNKIERDDVEAAAALLVRFEDRATIIDLIEASTLCLASIDREITALRQGDRALATNLASEARPRCDRLRAELADLDLRCQQRSERAALAAALSRLASLLLGAFLVSFFIARHRRRTASLASLEIQSRSAESRERRFQLLLEVEEAARDLTDPDRVLRGAMDLLGGFLLAPVCAFEAVDPTGRTTGPARGDLPRLGSEDLASLRMGRSRLVGDLVRCPLMRGGELCAVVSVLGDAGRGWTQDEIGLAEEVTARCGVFLERVDAEAARLRSRWTSALLDTQLNSSPDGIIIVDRENRRILQNSRMAEVWGLPADVLEDKDDDRQFALVCDAVKDVEGFTRAFRHLCQHEGESFHDEIELKDDTFLERHTAPALGTDGTYYGRIWTFRDITERIRAERALREAQEELEARVEARTRDLAAATRDAERANAAKSEFLSRMSHELRTPLNAILGFGQILDRQDLDELQKESVHYILKGGRHLLGLINEVLDLSRVETGNAELSIEPVPLAEVLDESCAMVRTMAAERGVLLEEDFDALEGTHVVADRQRLKQVLINLLSNAVKYNRPGGRVAVRCRPEEGRLRLAVEDTGAGIPPEGLAKLFVPFERLNAAATNVEGTGLGLYLTQRLVATMGGRLEVESVVEEGTSFYFDLELARDPVEGLVLVEGGEPEPTPDEDADRTYSVLSIDDNSSNLRLLEAILATRPEIRLTAASRGMEGFSVARRDAPDLILLDMNLPDVSGLEVLARLQRSGTTSGIPVIVVSADASEANAEASRAAGAFGFVAKPLEVAPFLRSLDAALGLRPAPLRAAA